MDLILDERDNEIIDKYIEWFINKFSKSPTESEIEDFKHEGFWIVKGFIPTYSLSNAFKKWAMEDIT